MEIHALKLKRAGPRVKAEFPFGGSHVTSLVFVSDWEFHLALSHGRVTRHDAVAPTPAEPLLLYGTNDTSLVMSTNDQM